MKIFSWTRLIAIILLCILMLAFFSGCLGLAPIMYNSGEAMADARLEKLLDAISKKDTDAVKDLFSEKAKSEAEDLDANIESLFEFFQGEVLSWEDDGGQSSGSYSKDGKVSSRVITWYRIVTEADTYLFFMYDYYKDTLDPTNEGLYSLRVIKAEDEDKYFTFAEDMKIPGIYIPEEYFNTEGE